jgi:hypothetical protein
MTTIAWSDLTQASVIGFGTRSWTGTQGQVRALELALGRGCSLIDAAWPLVADYVEPALGRTLAGRLDGAVVVCGAADLDPVALVRRVRTAAARLRRDRLDVLLLDDPERTLAATDGEQRIRRAVAVLESLADRGELGRYGLRIGRLPVSGSSPDRAGQTPAGALVRWLELARQIRPTHRLSVLQAPCEVLRPGARTQVPDLASVACQARLVTMGTRPVPVWPTSVGTSATICRRYLLDGVNHVVLEPRTPSQARAMAVLLPTRLPSRAC